MAGKILDAPDDLIDDSLPQTTQRVHESSFSGTFHGWELYRTALTAVISSLSFGIAIAATNAPAKVFFTCPTSPSDSSLLPECFPVSERAWGVMSSMLCLPGALIGSLSACVIADRRGRLWTLLRNAAIYGAGMLLCLLAFNYWMLLLGRLLIGVGVGVSCAVVPIYLAEMAPLELRGRVAFLHQLALVSGIVAAEAFYMVLGVEGGKWRLLFLANLLLHILQFGSLYYFCHESPKWLAFSNTSSSTSSTASSRRASFLETLKKSEARWSLIVALVLHAGQQLSGINGVMFFSRTLFPTEERVGFWLALINCTASFLSWWIVDRAGRRPVLLGSLAVMTFGAFGLCLSSASSGGILASLAKPALLVFIVGFAVGLGPLPWLLLAEIFPSSTAATFATAAVCVNWIATGAVTAAFLPAVTLLGLRAVFGFMMAVGMILIGFAFYGIPETRSRPSGYLCSPFE